MASQGGSLALFFRSPTSFELLYYTWGSFSCLRRCYTHTQWKRSKLHLSNRNAVALLGSSLRSSPPPGFFLPKKNSVDIDPLNGEFQATIQVVDWAVDRLARLEFT